MTRRGQLFRAREYVKVETLNEAYELNQKRSSVVVGGMMWLKMQNNYKVTVIDLSELKLDTVEEDEQEFRIGCMCSLRMLEQHEGLNRYFNSVFRECTRHIVGTQFRNGATVGGSVFGRYGFSDILTALMMFDTYVELHQGGILPLGEFAERKYDRDILVRVIVKKDGRQGAYITQRQSQTDFPVIACGVACKGDTWYVAVGARPHKAKCVTVLRTAAGEQPDYTGLAAQAVGQLDFHSNMRASGEYRKHLADVYIRRLMIQLDTEYGVKGDA